MIRMTLGWCAAAVADNAVARNKDNKTPKLKTVPKPVARDSNSKNLILDAAMETENCL